MAKFLGIPEKIKIDTSLFSDEVKEVLSRVLDEEGYIYTEKPVGISGNDEYVRRILAFHLTSRAKILPSLEHLCANIDAYDEEGNWSKMLERKCIRRLDSYIQAVLDVMPPELRWSNRREVHEQRELIATYCEEDYQLDDDIELETGLKLS